MMPRRGVATALIAAPLAAVPLLAAALLAAAAPVAAAPRCPDPSLRRGDVSIATASGRHRYRVEIATTADQEACGLMFRRQMAADAGMLFTFRPPRQLSFWMENTYLPLDIIFLDAKGRVLNVAARAEPLSRTLIDSRGVAASVVELNAGEAARIGLKPGDMVKLPR